MFKKIATNILIVSAAASVMPGCAARKGTADDSSTKNISNIDLIQRLNRYHGKTLTLKKMTVNLFDVDISDMNETLQVQASKFTNKDSPILTDSFGCAITLAKINETTDYNKLTVTVDKCNEPALNHKTKFHVRNVSWGVSGTDLDQPKKYDDESAVASEARAAYFTTFAKMALDKFEKTGHLEGNFDSRHLDIAAQRAGRATVENKIAVGDGVVVTTEFKNNGLFVTKTYQ